MDEQEPTMPYVKLTLWPDMAQDDGEFTHMPLAIEAWPPGLNVEFVLLHALAAVREGGEPT